MKIKTKAAIAATTTVLSAALAGGTTLALFTSSATNSNNTFQAGTLKIALDKADTPSTAYFNVTNMAPGDSEIRQVKVSNTGSLQLKYLLTLAVGGDLASGATPLTIAAYTTQPDAQNGTNAIDLTQYRTLDAQGGANTQETLFVKVTLPLGENNDYQTKTGTASITVNAVQTANNNSSPAPVTWLLAQYDDSSWGPIVDEGAGWGAHTQSDWVWADSTQAQETTYYRANFTTNQPKTITLEGTADNHMIVYLDGQQVLICDNWGTLYLSQAITIPAGQHTVAVQATNDGGPAGFAVDVVQSDNNTIPLTWKTHGNVQPY